MKKIVFLLSISAALLSSCKEEQILPLAPVSPITDTTKAVTPPVAQTPAVTPPVSQTPAVTPPVAQTPVPEFTSIPDSDFEKALIALGIDDAIDGKIRTANAITVESLVLKAKSITDMTGIQAFTNLKKLDLYQNYGLKSLDVSKNTKLTFLCISECDITTIDISKNTELTEIDFQNPSNSKVYGYTKGLTSLDVTKNTKLERIYIFANRLTTLDVSNCPNLTDLWIGGGEYGNTKSTTGGNLIQRLDLSGNPKLNVLVADNNKLTYLNIKNTARNGVPRTCITVNNPDLKEIKVSNVQAILTWALANPVWYEKDDATAYVL
jgi:hypothetical protein